MKVFGKCSNNYLETSGQNDSKSEEPVKVIVEDINENLSPETYFNKETFANLHKELDPFTLDEEEDTPVRQ